MRARRDVEARVTAAVVGLVLVGLVVGACAAPARAQDAPPVIPPDQVQSPVNTGPSPDAIGSAVGNAIMPGVVGFFEQSGAGIILRGLLWVVGNLAKWVVDTTTSGRVGHAALLTGLPPEYTWDNGLVGQARGLVQATALSLWGVICIAAVLWMAFRLLTAHAVADELGLLPLLAVALAGITLAPDFCRGLGEAVNEGAAAAHLGVTDLPGWGALSGFEQDVARARPPWCCCRSCGVCSSSGAWWWACGTCSTSPRR